MTVYYLRADNGAIKIGYTTNTSKRFSTISTASPLGLELVAQEGGGLKLERSRHSQFKSDSIRGEWFYPSDALNEHISQINPNFQPMPYVDHDNYHRMSAKEERVKDWFGTDRRDPPKIGIIVAIVGLLVTPLLHLAISTYPILTDEGVMLVSMAISPIFLFVIFGYILLKVWQIRSTWRDIRKDMNGSGK